MGYKEMWHTGLKSWSSYFNGQADQMVKGELKRKCRIIVEKDQMNGLDEV